MGTARLALVKQSLSEHVESQAGAVKISTVVEFPEGSTSVMVAGAEGSTGSTVPVIVIGTCVTVKSSLPLNVTSQLLSGALPEDETAVQPDTHVTVIGAGTADATCDSRFCTSVVRASTDAISSLSEVGKLRSCDALSMLRLSSWVTMFGTSLVKAVESEFVKVGTTDEVIELKVSVEVSDEERAEVKSLTIVGRELDWMSVAMFWTRVCSWFVISLSSAEAMLLATVAVSMLDWTFEMSVLKVLVISVSTSD